MGQSSGNEPAARQPGLHRDRRRRRLLTRRKGQDNLGLAGSDAASARLLRRQNSGKYENCCECEKCIRTILSFRIAGCPRPAAFKKDPTDAQIRDTRLEFVTKVYRWQQLARGAEAAGLGRTGWARAVRAVLRKQRWREFRHVLQRPFVPLRNKLRKLTRGTELSRSQVTRQREKREKDYRASLS